MSRMSCSFNYRFYFAVFIEDLRIFVPNLSNTCEKVISSSNNLLFLTIFILGHSFDVRYSLRLTHFHLFRWQLDSLSLMDDHFWGCAFHCVFGHNERMREFNGNTKSPTETRYTTKRHQIQIECKMQLMV